jgi:preprotein translocase subunit SecF
MMEFFRDTHIDFMKYRKFFVVVSLILVAISILAVFVLGKLNLGVDFAGGTQITVKFKHSQEMNDLRALTAAAGIEDAQIQSFGDAEDNEALIRSSLVSGQEEGTQQLVLDALNREFNTGAQDRFDLNQQGSVTLASLLFERDPDQVRAQDEEVARNHYDEVADAVLDLRRQKGLLDSWDEIAALPLVSEETLALLQQDTDLGEFAILGVESVGPQIGSELRRKGILAVVSSLIGMLIYIWFRFELRFGVGALVAVTHDVLIVLGLFVIAGFEFNLTTIAGFLTLVGYSVNDTVVVFDRVRENLRRSRREPLIDVMNKSLNQTLSRTVLTSGTTIMVVACLFFLGGDVLRGFAFILTVGVIVGTYSSIYVASPFALFWENLSGRSRKRSA